MRRALFLAFLLLSPACGDDTQGPTDLAAPSDMSAARDLNLGVCACLAQLCAAHCADPSALECGRCLHNGQQSPDMGCIASAPGQCGACYAVPGCIDPRF